MKARMTKHLFHRQDVIATSGALGCGDIAGPAYYQILRYSKSASNPGHDKYFYYAYQFGYDPLRGLVKSDDTPVLVELFARGFLPDAFVRVEDRAVSLCDALAHGI